MVNHEFPAFYSEFIFKVHWNDLVAKRGVDQD